MKICLYKAKTNVIFVYSVAYLGPCYIYEKLHCLTRPSMEGSAFLKVRNDIQMKFRNIVIFSHVGINSYHYDI